MLKLPENLSKDRKLLLDWYQKNKRALPWRNSKSPYFIWISEVMLQQTTVTAVIPYYEKFLKRFPSVESLSSARIEDIYEYWAGLGYYSRARNLHRAAQIIVNDHQGFFPKTAQELILLPGFGPYTSRAVSSLAFDEKVGVLDGNVIRILTRRFGLKINWWETQSKQYLQNISDALAFTSESADMNQAMMELGATICTPKKTMCLLCPWKKECKAFEKNEIEILPLKKAKDDLEIWQWNFYPEIKKNKILLYENKSTPFLKNTWLPYSTAKKIGSKPKVFSFKHSVTKYEIFINLKKADPKNKISKGQLVEFDKISQINPTSLIKKIMSHLETL